MHTDGETEFESAHDSIAASCMQQQVPKLSSIQAARRELLRAARTRVVSSEKRLAARQWVLGVHWRARTQPTTRDALNRLATAVEW